MIVPVPGVESFDLPIPSLANSLDSPFSHVSFWLVLIRCLYSSSCPVASSITALVEWRRGRHWRNRCGGVCGRTER